MSNNTLPVFHPLSVTTSLLIYSTALSKLRGILTCADTKTEKRLTLNTPAKNTRSLGSLLVIRVFINITDNKIKYFIANYAQGHNVDIIKVFIEHLNFYYISIIFRKEKKIKQIFGIPNIYLLFNIKLLKHIFGILCTNL